MIPVCEPLLDGNEQRYIEQCLKDNWIAAEGRFTKLFEMNFANYCGCKYAVTCSSGTAALHLALAAIGVEPDDEVIVPDLTIASCAFAVEYLNAMPIFVDCDAHTFNINVEQIETVITSRTKAIMPVHLYGRPCEMDSIMNLARKYNLKVVEDAAEAHGAEYKGKKVGSIGDVGCFSFYSNKLMTSGEGGMVVTNDDGIADKVRHLKDLNHSPTRRFYHEAIGYNYRLTNIQAAIGFAQLETLDRHIAMRAQHATLYASLLANIPGLTFCQEDRPYVKAVDWMHCVLMDSEEHRDELMDYLSKRNIGTRTFFVPLHQQPLYEDEDVDYPVAIYLSKRGLYLPSGTGLDNDHITYVCDYIKECMNE